MNKQDEEQLQSSDAPKYDTHLVHLDKGLANYSQGNHKLAITEFNSAISINSNLGDAYANRALA